MNLNPASEHQAISVVQELLNAEFCDSAIQQVADVRLVLVKNIDQLTLSETATIYLGEDRFDDRGLHPESGSLSTGEAEVVENVAFCNVRWFAHFVTTPLV